MRTETHSFFKKETTENQMNRHNYVKRGFLTSGLLAVVWAFILLGLPGAAVAQDGGLSWEEEVPDAAAVVVEKPETGEAVPAVEPAGEEAVVEEDDIEFRGIDMQPEELSISEQIKRQELVLRAEHELEQARAAFVAEDFEQAVKLYDDAKKHLLKAGATEENREKVRKIDRLVADVYVKWGDSVAEEAEKLADANQFEDAIAKAGQAAKHNPKSAKMMEERIRRYKVMQEKAVVQSQVSMTRIDPTGEEREQKIKILLERGRRLYDKNRFMAARDEFEQVLVLDPFDIDATNGLLLINRKLNAYAEARRQVIEMERIAENSWKWSEPITPLGNDALDRQETIAVDKEREATRGIEQKLETIVLPRIDFEEATIHQVIRFLRDKSRELDPEGKGVSIVFQKGSGPAAEGEAAAPAPGGFDFGEGGGAAEPDWGAFGGDAAPPAPGAGAAEPQVKGTVTIAATDIPLKDAIRFVCESAGLQYRVTRFAVIIGEELRTEMETRIFDVPQGMFGIDRTADAAPLMDQWAGGAAAGRGGEEESDTDMRAFLTQLGIAFPTDSAAKLIRNKTKLWARNTPENLKLIQDFLDASRIDEHQVTIEAKFVEISQNDLEALGFEWLINNGDGLAISTGGDYEWSNGGKWNYGGEGKSAILKQDPSGAWPFNSALTGALRYANFDPTFFSGNDKVLSIQSVLGSMEFTTVIHAINRADSTDILSCPKVTAKSDETAILRMVTERYFPTSWTEPEIESGGTDNNSTYKPSIPEFGEARDIGVVLEATPKVDPKKEYLIDLLLRPQVYDFLGYDTDLNYVMVIDGEEVEGKAQMPIIAARTVETSVMVWDGETVVLGGMISEHLTEYDDKVPVLGDIPLLGRLFQSRGKKSEKRNLLIFVTARLVDPAGRPKRASNEMRGIPEFGR